MSPPSRRRVIVVLLVVAAVAGGAVWTWSGGTRPIPPQPAEFPFPPFREYAFLNTGPGREVHRQRRVRRVPSREPPIVPAHRAQPGVGPG